MDFNPLDLLASAAELQQKGDDDPERIIATQHSKKSQLKQPFTMGQKDNFGLVKSKNSNNSLIKGKPSIVIVKKMKVDSNPELEKMLDEHNYGNAKRGNNQSRSVDTNTCTNLSIQGQSIDINICTNINNQGKGALDTNTCTDINGKEEKKKSELDIVCHLVTLASTSERQHEDSNTVISSPTSQFSDSANVLCVRKCKVCVDTCTGSCSLISKTCNTELLDLHKCLLCNLEQCNCQMSSRKFVGTGNIKVNNLSCDSECGAPDNLICDCKHTHSVQQTSEVEEQFKLDDKTGEFVTETGTRGNVNISQEQDNSFCSDLNGKQMYNSCIEKVSEPLQSSGTEVITDMVSVTPVQCEAVSTHVQCEAVSTKNINCKSLSEHIEMPHVNVLSSKLNGDPVVEKPEISINNFEDVNQSLSCEGKSHSETGGNVSDGVKNSLIQPEFVDKPDLALDPVDPVFKFVSKNTSMKMECNLALGKKTGSCTSLEEFDMICSESSPGVHLLSPDRRNPDSVGIVESPISQPTFENDEKNDIISNSKVLSNHISDFGAGMVISKVSETAPCNENSASCSSEFNLESHEGQTILKEKDLKNDSGFVFPEKEICSDISTNKSPPNSGDANNIFIFESDHCYAGLPEKFKVVKIASKNDASFQREGEEAHTPLSSTSELSPDSGYEVSRSPSTETVMTLQEELDVRPPMKNLVPVLVSVNSAGCLTVHNTNFASALGGPVLALSDSLPTFKPGINLITGTKLTPVSQNPLFLSAVGKTSSPIVCEVPQMLQAKPDNIEVISPPDANLQPFLTAKQEQFSPLKFGKFRIGTFASFSNTGIVIDESQKKNYSTKSLLEDKVKKAPELTTKVMSVNGRTSYTLCGKTSPAVCGKISPAIVDTLGSLVQKVKSNLSPSSHNLNGNDMDHIQHDHDYCTKNLMPSVVSNFLEARLLTKDCVKMKQSQSKSKKVDGDMTKAESKSGKHKRHLISKDDESIDEIDSESDNQSLSDSFKGKFKSDKFCEPKRTEPKVKITGSSDFQDQFVYFMNTKKRSRRRESKDSPLPYPTDRFIPPKPGDIIVPHLTDQDIENLKLRSSQSKQPANSSGCNSLKNEFMAAKLSNTPFPVHPHTEIYTVDDEKNLINTILSLEKEILATPVSPESPAFNESMELYGQGLGGDFMSLLPEQMNLTQEQMDLLYSAVDELQNSSPGAVGAEKLVLTNSSQFPSFGNATGSTNKETDSDGKLLEASCDKTQAVQHTKEIVIHKPPESAEQIDLNESNKTDSKTTVEVKDTTFSGGHIIVADENSKPVCENKTCENDDITKKLDAASCISSLIRTETDSLTVSANIPHEIAHKVELPSSEKYIAVPVSQACSVQLTPEVGSLSSSNAITSDSSLPQFDKSLELLGTDFRLDKGELFSESTLSVNQNVLCSFNSAQNSMDYNAPWIVTVSMYWNDLPAIMINNQPYVRLVDIHKQILPAKDTGILKKRCQLMGIEVENCSEMQRYFLVQYGRAINSKSTLVISKENAKELIGYYVDPQPKSAIRLDDHKSIIDHRREQLRRMAFARRVTLKAQLLNEKEKPDSRMITQPFNSEEHLDLQPVSTPVIPKRSQVPKVEPCIPKTQEIIAARSQRSTRHKKINFLEMLRGDSNGHDEELDDVYCNNNKNSNKFVPGEVKNRKLKEQKLKELKCNIETESNEDTESLESEYCSSYETDSTNESGALVSKQARQMKVNHKMFETKAKNNKANILPSKTLNRKSMLKVKFGTVRSRPNVSSTSMAIKVVDKSIGTVPSGPQLFRHRLPLPKLISPENKRSNTSSPPVIVELLPTYDGMGAFNENIDELRTEATLEVAGHEGIVYSNKSNECLVSNDAANVDDVQMMEADMKVPTTLPEMILQLSDTCTASSQIKNQTITTVVENRESDAMEDQSENEICHVRSKEVDSLEMLYNERTSDGINNNEGTNVNDDIFEVASTSKKDSIVINDTSTSASHVMKRKEVVQVCSDEIPLRIIHRDSSTHTEPKTRSQLGEIFVERYHNKKSHCVRCYTCRKIMSVDNFMRHLHDVVSGGLLPLINSRTIDTGDSEITEPERKLWETFQRKKELFDNNQLPSPDVGEGLIYKIDAQYKPISLLNNTAEKPIKQSGPRIITTSLSPRKKLKVVHDKPLVTQINTGVNQSCLKQSVVTESNDGVRTSSRKRKMKQLYPFESYSFTKYPRLTNSPDDSADNQ